ncbi:MAG: LuxR C-terminal-related transcriptional regulator [Gaiellaceae bacterium]
MQVLIAQRQEDLERIRLSAAQLDEQFRASGARTDPIELVEVISGRAALIQQFEQLQRSAEEEVLIFDRPPYARAGNELEMELLARAVRYRVLYDESAFELPGRVEEIQRSAEAGEEARVLRDVPMKLAIADRKLALVPLRFEDPGLEAILLIHASPLLEALRRLFEMLWENGASFRFGNTGGATRSVEQSSLSSGDRQLLALASAGFKDEVIARQLGIARRTVQRRLRRMMNVLGAQNRVQLLLRATEQGLV